LSKPTFSITEMKIGGYSLSVPHGLSELLNRANAWCIREEPNFSSGYHREVIKKDNGRIVTVLTKIGKD